MAYQCRDCSFKGRTFPAGTCPACGSFNIVSLKDSGEGKQPKARSSFRLGLGVALWIYLIYAIYDKLS